MKDVLRGLTAIVMCLAIISIGKWAESLVDYPGNTAAAADVLTPVANNGSVLALSDQAMDRYVKMVEAGETPELTPQSGTAGELSLENSPAFAVQRFRDDLDKNMNVQRDLQVGFNKYGVAAKYWPEMRERFYRETRDEMIHRMGQYIDQHGKETLAEHAEQIGKEAMGLTYTRFFVACSQQK